MKYRRCSLPRYAELSPISFYKKECSSRQTSTASVEVRFGQPAAVLDDN